MNRTKRNTGDFEEQNSIPQAAAFRSRIKSVVYLVTGRGRVNRGGLPLCGLPTFHYPKSKKNDYGDLLLRRRRQESSPTRGSNPQPFDVLSMLSH